jgi:threonine/homoserine/homoserine lactone efflux protein
MENLAPLIGFAFVSSITPGPNNMMLLASGANFGTRATVPHMLGISIGHAVMIVLVGFGLMGLILAWPPAGRILFWASILYLLWLALRLALADPVPPEGRARSTPLGFLGAAGFQWVNPKAWYMATTALATYPLWPGLTGVIALAVTFACVNLPCIAVWALAGERLRAVLTTRTRMRAFNVGMAMLLLATLWPVLRG